MIKLLVFTVLCVSCTKAIESSQKQVVDSYKVMIDKYNLDTTELLNRIIWWQDTISKASDKLLLDTTRDIWTYHCPDTTKPAWNEHIYIVRNGRKTQPSKYPK